MKGRRNLGSKKNLNQMMKENYNDNEDKKNSNNERKK